MFNMTKIRASNAAGKSFYANHLASNDYYSEHEKVVGFWRGSLAGNFGLAGQEVTDSVFSLFQRNINPATGDNLTQKKVSGGPRFFDFQVAAPKSVSVMALFDERLTAAHQAAVREAMGELEALAAVRVRAGENVRTNNHENTGKLIYAEFMHDTSRALDPQLHTHNVVCNVTNADGQYKALETLEMCKAIRYAGKVYHNALARKCRELGYELTPVLDRKQNVLWFDLKGVPEDVMERFSKRRKQIEEAEAAFIAEHGRKPTLAENNAISNSTRSAKMQTSTREKVRDLQLKQLSENELAQLKSLVKPGAVIEAMDREQCRDVIRETMAELFERESVVTQDKLLAEVLNYSLGSFELNDLKNVLQEIPELKKLGGEAVNPFYSPQEVIEREQNSIESVEDQQGIFEPLARDFVPFEGNDSRREQADLIRGLLASPDRFNLFRGVAGAGKTSTLQEFCKGLKSANVENIVVVAPTNSATDVLKQEGFEQSQTVASFLFSGEKPPEKSYIIIDEAGLNSLREGYEILKLARKNNYRVLFVGDARQHNAVESGDFFRLLEDYSRIRKFELNQIHRQRNEEYRRGIFECSQGQFEQAFERFDQQDFIHEGKDYLDAAAAKFMEFTHDGTDLSQAIMVAPTHAECDRLTAALREKLKAAKRLGMESQTVTVFRSWNKPKAWMEQAKNYHEGMNLSFIRNLKGVAKAGELDTVAAVENGRIRLKSGRSLTLKEASQFVDAGEVKQIELRSGDLIQFRANRKDLKIYNGTMARVSRKAGYVDLLDKSGAVRRSIELPAGYAAFDYGWVTTSHKSQGRTAQNVVAAAEKMDAKAFYVALSRGREQLSMHCPDKALLKQHLLRNSGDRLSVHDLIRNREIPSYGILPLANEARKQKAALLPDFSYKEISARIKRTAEQVKQLFRNPGIIFKMRNHRAKFNRHIPDKDENKGMFERLKKFFVKQKPIEEPKAEPEEIVFKPRSREEEMWKIYNAAWAQYEARRREYHAVFGRGEFSFTHEEEEFTKRQRLRFHSGQEPGSLPDWMSDWQKIAIPEAERTQREFAAAELKKHWETADSLWDRRSKERKEWWQKQSIVFEFKPWKEELEFAEIQNQRRANGLDPLEIPEDLANWKTRAEVEYRKLETAELARREAVRQAELEKKRFNDAWLSCDAELVKLESEWNQWWANQSLKFTPIPELKGLNEFKKSLAELRESGKYPAKIPNLLMNWKRSAKSLYHNYCAEYERKRMAELKRRWRLFDDAVNKYFRSRLPRVELNEEEQQLITAAQTLRQNGKLPPEIPAWLTAEAPPSEQIKAAHYWQIWDKYKVSPNDARHQTGTQRRAAYEQAKSRIEQEIKEYEDSILDMQIQKIQQKTPHEKTDLEQLRTLFQQRYGSAGEAKYDEYIDSITPKPTPEQMSELNRYFKAGYLRNVPPRLSRDEAVDLLKRCQAAEQQEAERKEAQRLEAERQEAKRQKALNSAWAKFDDNVDKYFRSRRPRINLNDAEQQFLSSAQTLRQNGKLPPEIPAWMTEWPSLSEWIIASDHWKIWEKYNVTPADGRESIDSPQRTAYERVKNKIQREIEECDGSDLNQRIQNLLHKEYLYMLDSSRLRSLLLRKYGDSEGSQIYKEYIGTITQRTHQFQDQNTEERAKKYSHSNEIEAERLPEDHHTAEKQAALERERRTHPVTSRTRKSLELFKRSGQLESIPEGISEREANEIINRLTDDLPANELAIRQIQKAIYNGLLPESVKEKLPTLTRGQYRKLIEKIQSDKNQNRGYRGPGID